MKSLEMNGSEFRPLKIFARRALLILGLVTFMSNVSAQEWRGFPYPSFVTRLSYISLTSGDFNGDGIADLATTNAVSANVSVLIGIEDSMNPGFGDGTFCNPVFYAAGNDPVNIAKGDFNGDGITDLVTANYQSNSVSILLGNEDVYNPGIGDGTFSTQMSYATSNEPISVTTGDFNGDDITDLATANLDTNDVSVLIGNGSEGTGDGTFSTHISYAAGLRPASVTTGDFNGDGIIDLVTTNRDSDDISVLLGNGSENKGDGTFASEVVYITGTNPTKITTGDFNGDGITDLVTSNRDSDNVSVLLGIEDTGNLGYGDGTFANLVNYAVGENPLNIATGDFNGDGITDLATTNSESDNVSVLLGNGNGGIGDGTFTAHVLYSVGEFPWGITTGDFNGDGITDIANTNWLSSYISVLLGNVDDNNPSDGDGTFATQINYSVGDIPWNITTCDVNGDGITDLAAANAESDNVSVLLGIENSMNPGFGYGTFETEINYSVGESPRSVITCDFNGDGITDLVTANAESDDLSVLLGIEDSMNLGFSDGTFETEINYTVGDSPWSVTKGDFNGDGITDLATANADSDNVSVLLGIEDSMNPGVGDGTFSTQVNYSVGDSPRSVTACDFNGDGITDLATANAGSDNISVLLGIEDSTNPGVGDGTFAAEVNYLVGDGPRSVTASDFNGDGITDLATANFSSDNVSILLGNEDEFNPGIGDGTFSTQIMYSTGIQPVNVKTGDLNGDGIFDLVTANSRSDTVSILLGKKDSENSSFGDGTFEEQITYAVGIRPYCVDIGDFNGDGYIDLATVNGQSDNVSVLMNLGFTEPEPSFTPESLAFGDVELGSGPPSLSVTINVTGDTDLISTPTLTDDGGGDFSLVSVPVSPLAQGTSDTLGVSFTPFGLGLTTGTVTLETNDLSSPTITIALSGTGVDTIAATSSVTAPTGSLTQMDPIISIEYTASDNSGGSGVQDVELFYSFASTKGTVFTSAGTFTSSPISFDTTAIGGQGTYEFYTLATDVAGNTETDTGTADVTVIFNNNTNVDDWKVLND